MGRIIVWYQSETGATMLSHALAQPLEIEYASLQNFVRQGMGFWDRNAWIPEHSVIRVQFVRDQDNE